MLTDGIVTETTHSPILNRTEGTGLKPHPDLWKLDQACRKQVLKQASGFLNQGLTLSELILEGKQEAEKARQEFDPQKKLSFDFYLRWRLKARYYNLLIRQKPQAAR